VRHLVLTHSIVGKPAEMDFLPDRSNTACKICGTVFQSWYDRLPHEEVTPLTELAGLIERQEWSQKHSKTHPEHVHLSLQRSGRFATPDATVKLAAYGISPISDMVFDDESRLAALASPRCPFDDVETTRSPAKGVQVAIR
jgi:hypothetical protein